MTVKNNFRRKMLLLIQSLMIMLLLAQNVYAIDFGEGDNWVSVDDGYVLTNEDAAAIIFKPAGDGSEFEEDFLLEFWSSDNQFKVIVPILKANNFEGIARRVPAGEYYFSGAKNINNNSVPAKVELNMDDGYVFEAGKTKEFTYYSESWIEDQLSSPELDQEQKDLHNGVHEETSDGIEETKDTEDENEKKKTIPLKIFGIALGGFAVALVILLVIKKITEDENILE